MLHASWAVTKMPQRPLLHLRRQSPSHRTDDPLQQPRSGTPTGTGKGGREEEAAGQGLWGGPRCPRRRIPQPTLAASFEKRVRRTDRGARLARTTF